MTLLSMDPWCRSADITRSPLHATRWMKVMVESNVWQIGSAAGQRNLWNWGFFTCHCKMKAHSGIYLGFQVQMPPGWNNSKTESLFLCTWWPSKVQHHQGWHYAPFINWATVCVWFSPNRFHATLKLVKLTFEMPLFSQVCQSLSSDFNKNKELAGKVPKVKKSLNGECHAPKLWYNHLWKGLETLRFQVSKYEPGLFMHACCIIVIYVNDAIILAKDHSQVD